MSAYIRGQMFRPIGAGKPPPLYPPEDEDVEEQEDAGQGEPEAADEDYDYDDELDDEDGDAEDEGDGEEEEEMEGEMEELPYDELRRQSFETEADLSITAATESTLRPLEGGDRPRLVDVRPKVVLVLSEEYDDLDDRDDDFDHHEYYNKPKSTAVPRYSQAEVTSSPPSSHQENRSAKPELGSASPRALSKPRIEEPGSKSPSAKTFRPEVQSRLAELASSPRPEVKLTRSPHVASSTRPAIVASSRSTPSKPEVHVPEVGTSSNEPEIAAGHRIRESIASYVALPVELARDAAWSARQVAHELRQLISDEEGRLSRNFRSSCFHYASLLMVTYVYLFAGAFVFKVLEGFFEVSRKCDVQRHRYDLIEDLWNQSAFLDYDDWRRAARNHLRNFEETVHRAHQQGVTTYSGSQIWSLDGALVYSATVLTTIGYGHIVPSTTAGRIATILYAIIGIPLLLMVLADFGKLLTLGIKCLMAFTVRFYHTGSFRKLRRTKPVQAVTKVFTRNSNEPGGEDQEYADDGLYPDNPAYQIDDEFNLPAWFTVLLLVAYIMLGACMFIQWERHWSYFEAVYFVFISMSTIGFGDYVPEHPIFMMGTFVYLLFGLSLTSMCINVIQESLTRSFRQASVKLSARMGLELGNTSFEPAPDIAPVHYPVRTKNE